MASMSDFIKEMILLNPDKGRQELFKRKGNINEPFGKHIIIKNRHKVLKNQKLSRNIMIDDRRKIVMDEEGSEQSRPRNRLEIMKQWKKERDEKKQLEKRNHKPVFKVMHVAQPIGLPNLENVNKEIKGVLFKRKIDPKEGSNKPMPSTSSHRTMVTRSQSKKANELPVSAPKQSEKTPIMPLPTKKGPKANPKPINYPPEPAMPSLSNKGSKANAKPTTLQVEPKPGPKPKVEAIAKETLPTKNSRIEPLVVRSPFVTVSRGKLNARKEFETRKLLEASPKIPKASAETKEGAQRFTILLDDEIARLRMQIEHWETYKSSESLPEEAVEMIDVAVGQTNLLITKKFNQFRGLIHRCANAEGEEVVTVDDLHGFWDMLLIQTDNLGQRFENLVKMKANKWVEVVPDVKEVVKKKAKQTKANKASSVMREVIAAARRQKLGLANDQIVGAKVASSVLQEVADNLEAITTPRKSHLNTMAKSDRKRVSSPGLSMIWATQHAKTVETPGKSILKSDVTKITNTLSKIVLFQDEVDDVQDVIKQLNLKSANSDDTDVENENPNILNSAQKDNAMNKTPKMATRRSVRIGNKATL